MRIALGTAQFGLSYGVSNLAGKVSQNQATEILKFAKTSGIDTIDTAMSYGDSESMLGKIGVKSFKVITKLSEIENGCKNVSDWVVGRVEDSLRRLGLDRLDGFLLHQPAQLFQANGESLYGTLEKLKEQGLVRKIGVSVYSPLELNPLFERFTFDIVQAPLNIFDRSLVDSGWVEKLNKMGVEIHARSIFLQGLLLMREDLRPEKFAIWEKLWREWDIYLQETEQSALQACLGYVNSIKELDRLVVGVEGVGHLENIINALDDESFVQPNFKSVSDARLINPISWSHL